MRDVTPQHPYSVGLDRSGQPHAQSSLSSSNDLEAIRTWLDVKCNNSAHTRIAYEKEARRFLVFMLYELGLSGLADVKVEHLQAYWHHLAHPPEHWIMQYGQPNGSSHATTQTRLLRGALAKSSIAYSRTVINGLYAYLNDANYLMQNPVIVSRKIQVHKNQQDKGLEPEAWRVFWAWLLQQERQETQPERLRLAIRNRWMCALLYHSGLRRSSIASAKMNQFARRHGEWTLTVTVKGDRQHQIVVGEFLLQELQYYRQRMGMSYLPTPDDDRPLISNLRKPNLSVTGRNIGYLFQAMTEACAKTCIDPYLSTQIQKLTCHGVRHTFATHSLMAGARLESVQHALGHQSITTTSLYAKVNLQMQKELANLLDQSWRKAQGG